MDDDSKIIFFYQPDPWERRIRFVCGALFGLLLGLLAWARFQLPWVPGVLMTLVTGYAFAAGARKYGDEFWFRSIRWLTWPWRR